MNKDKPLVSVIIPTRNRTEILNKCLDSLYAQDYPNFEVIMIDASTNHDTEKIIKEQYPQVKYIPFLHKANMRPQSKNLGIEAAKGEILAFIDDDSFVQ